MVISVFFAFILITQVSYAQQNVGAVLTRGIGFLANLSYPAKSSRARTSAETGLLPIHIGTGGKKLQLAEMGKSIRNLTLFPNPASTTINIKPAGNSDSEEYTLRIMDVSGLIKVREVWNGNPIDISALPPGFYTILLCKEDKIFTQKLVIAR
jgi:hypothetical protein